MCQLACSRKQSSSSKNRAIVIMAIVPVPMITTILAIVAIESTITEVVARRAKIVCICRQVYYTHVSLSPTI